MTRLSLLDKLGIVFNTIFHSKLLIALFALFIAMGLLFFLISRKNKKIGKYLYIILLGSILVYLGISYYTSLGKMFEYMMDNFFIALYFPNLAIYLAAIIAMNIIVWITVFHDKSSKLIKGLNIVVYFILNYLLVLLLNVIHTEKLDVFSQTSIYKNDQARAFIELSSAIFVIWIIFLILYKGILLYLENGKKKKKEEKVVETNNELEIYEFVEDEDKNYQITTIPNVAYGKGTKKKNYQILNTPSIVHKDEKQEIEKDYQPVDMPEKIFGKGTSKKVKPIYRKRTLWEKFLGIPEEKPIAQKIVLKEKNYQSVEVPDKVLSNNKKPKEEKLLENQFTLEDYKLFSDILKNKKEEITTKKYKAVNNKKSEEVHTSLNNRISLEQEILELEEERRKLLEKNLAKERKQIEKEEKNKEKQRELDKMTEIERLYQGINY